MSEYFTSAEQLKEVFQLSEDSGYAKFTPFTKVDHFKGRVFRWKVNSVYKSASLCKPLIDLFKWLLKIICGRTIEAGDISRVGGGRTMIGQNKWLKSNIEAFLWWHLLPLEWHFWAQK